MLNKLSNEIGVGLLIITDFVLNKISKTGMKKAKEQSEKITESTVNTKTKAMFNL